MTPLAELAKQTVEACITEGRIVLPAPQSLTPEMQEPAGVFVSIKQREGALRGCIGTIRPLCRNVCEEVMTNAIKAALMDPRFPPVTEEELPDLVYSVDILTEPYRIEDLHGQDPQKHGLLVEGVRGQGLLLPGIDGISLPEMQEYSCRQKAGIPLDEPVTLYRFEVRRYQQP